MPEPAPDLREKLLSLQEVSPAMRNSYRQELEAMLRPPLKTRSALLGIVLLVLLLGCTILIVRADVVYHVRGLMLAGHVALAVAFIAASILILRELRQRRHSQKSVASISGILTVAAGTLTVVALLIGLRSPSDPKSLFGAFYVFVFYFACAIWSIENRIASAELASREQSLRIEYRLADLAERLEKR
jgi:cytochrome bd-type quinol oxidase subunit 2